MSTTLGTLLLVLQAETSAFARGMGDAKKLAFSSSGEIVDSLKRVGEQLGKLKFGNEAQWLKSGAIMGGVVAGIGAAVATSSIIVAKEVAEQVKQMSKLSQSYGLSISEVSQLRVASKLTGVDMDTLAMGMGRLAKAAAMATEGHKQQAQAFAILGVKVADAQGHLLPMNQLLPSLAERFAKLQDGTGKTALAMQLFGRSGAALIPFLNRGSEGIKQLLALSDQLGLTWSEKDGAAAEAFQQRIEILDLKTTALKENFVKGLLPALDALSSAFVTTDANGNSLAKDLGSSLGESLKILALTINEIVAGFKELWAVGKTFEKGFSLGTALVPGVGMLGGLLAISQSNEVGAAIDKIEAQRERIAFQIEHPGQTPIVPGTPPGKGNPTFGGGAGSKNPDAGLEALLNKARDLYNKGRGDSLETEISNIERLKQQLQSFAAAHPEHVFLDINAAIQKLNTSEGELIAKRQGVLQEELAKGSWAQIGEMLKMPSSIPMASGEVQSQSNAIDLAKDLNEQKRMQLQIFEQTRTPLERYNSDIATLNLLYADKSSVEYTRALRDAKEQLAGAYDPTIRLQKAIENLNDAYRAGAITVANYKQQLKELQAQQALDATRTNPAPGIGGVGQGIGAGAKAVAAEWRGLPAEIADSTIQIGHSIESNMGKAITDMVMGTKTIGQAFAEMGRNILASIAQTCAQMLAKWVTTHIIMAAVAKVFGGAGDSGAQQAAKTAARNVGMAESYTGVAAAEAFAFYMPEGLPVAVAMAAVADAIGQVFVGQAGSAIASAAGGMDVDRDQLIYAHKEEKVLPARFARGLDAIINSFRMPQAGPGHLAFAGAGGGPSNISSYSGHTFQITNHNYGVDPDEVADRTFAKVQSFFRTGGVRRK